MNENNLNLQNQLNNKNIELDSEKNKIKTLEENYEKIKKEKSESTQDNKEKEIEELKIQITKLNELNNKLQQENEEKTKKIIEINNNNNNNNLNNKNNDNLNNNNNNDNETIPLSKFNEVLLKLNEIELHSQKLEEKNKQLKEKLKMKNQKNENNIVSDKVNSGSKLSEGESKNIFHNVTEGNVENLNNPKLNQSNISRKHDDTRKLLQSQLQMFKEQYRIENDKVNKISELFKNLLKNIKYDSKNSVIANDICNILGFSPNTTNSLIKEKKGLFGKSKK